MSPVIKRGATTMSRRRKYSSGIFGELLILSVDFWIQKAPNVSDIIHSKDRWTHWLVPNQNPLSSWSWSRRSRPKSSSHYVSRILRRTRNQWTRRFHVDIPLKCCDSSFVHVRALSYCIDLSRFLLTLTPSDVCIIVAFIVIISVVVSADIVVGVLTLDWYVFRSFGVTVTEAEISDSCHSSYPEEDDVLMTNFVSSVVVDDVSNHSPNFHLVILSRSPFERSAARWFSVINRLLIVTCDITLFESLVTSLWNASRQVILDECCGCRRQFSSTKKKTSVRVVMLNSFVASSLGTSIHSETTLLVRYSLDTSRTWRIVVRTDNDLIGLDRGRWSHLRNEKH